MNSDSTFPEEAKVFKLRWDWPYEAGVVDKWRSPLSADEFVELRKAEVRYSGVELNTFNEIRARYTPPRFFSFFGAIRPGELAFSRWVCTRENSFEVLKERGLWHDMLSRLAAANGGAAREHPIVYPLPIAKPESKWVYPKMVLILDTEQGLAAAVDWGVGCEYLKLNKTSG